jgi:hypothetical protein
MTESERSDDKSHLGVGTGIALGLTFGAAVGMLLFDNLAVGAGVGLLLGIVIGSAFDARSTGSKTE